MRRVVSPLDTGTRPAMRSNPEPTEVHPDLATLRSPRSNSNFWRLGFF